MTTVPASTTPARADAAPAAGAVQDFLVRNDAVMVEKYGTHYYTQPDLGREYPSVTSILNVLPKPQLVNWAVKQACTYMHDWLDDPDTADDLNVPALREVVSQASKAHDRVRDDAASVGSEAHMLIEQSLREPAGWEPDKSDESEPADHARTALRYLRAMDLVPIAAEIPVLSLPYLRKIHDQFYVLAPGYGGTIDMICRVKDTNRIALLDWKTSRSKYDSHKYQAVAYMRALERLVPEAAGRITPIIFYTRGDGGDVILDDPEERHAYMQTFERAAALWDSLHKRESVYAAP